MASLVYNILMDDRELRKQRGLEQSKKTENLLRVDLLALLQEELSREDAVEIQVDISVLGEFQNILVGTVAQRYDFEQLDGHSGTLYRFTDKVVL